MKRANPFIQPSAMLAALLLASITPAWAHFQLIHHDGYLRDKGGSITLSMPFTHPSQGAPMMAMAGKPTAFSLQHRDETSDLSAELTSIDWHEPSGNNPQPAWQATVKLRRMGDYVFSLTPVPYFEASEDKYIQQYTKVIYNVGGLPTNWQQSNGAPFEIMPDLAPYAVYAGGLFSGVVMANGKPYPNAELEVEYLNHATNRDGNGFAEAAHIRYPNKHMYIQTIKADEQGRFHFVPPVPGYWGFAALDLDDDQHYEDKPLSQDAVLWIQAHELRRNN